MIPHSRPTLDELDVEAVAEVIRSGNIAQGKRVEKFESIMGSYIGVGGAVALNSGTAALHLSLLCLGVKEGDEILIPSYACSAILNVVYYTGAKPRLVDIDKITYNMDPDMVEGYLKRDKEKRIKAIILVHTFGQPADIGAFRELSDKYNIAIIEDSAQALGATFKGKKVGSFGLISVLSFYATKVISTGEGGMILSDSKEIIKKAKDLREYDKKDLFRIRYNYKLTDMAASMGISQMKRLTSFLKRREEIASEYNNALEREVRKGKAGEGRIYYRYVLESKNADEFIKLMKKDGICCKRPVFMPIHNYTGERGFHNSQSAWERAISIPIYPSLTDEEVQRISDSLLRSRGMIE